MKKTAKMNTATAEKGESAAVKKAEMMAPKAAKPKTMPAFLNKGKKGAK